MMGYMKDNPEYFSNRRNVGIWWWEFEDYFPYADAYKYVDGLIVFTDFVSDTLRKATNGDFKIYKLPYPFIEDWGQLNDISLTRDKFRISRGAFVYVFSFYLQSGYERKNPASVLKAFKRVVDKNEDENLLLALKCNNSRNDHYESLMKLITEECLHDKIILITDSLTRNELISLFNACDVYVSLHRSEGLGLGMLEAMAIGKPVIATAYGGNMEFMNHDNSCLVDYEYTTVKYDFGPYKKGWKWADPNILQASDYMIRLFEDKDFYDTKSAVAKQHVKNEYDNRNFDSLVSKVLQQI